MFAKIPAKLGQVCMGASITLFKTFISTHRYYLLVIWSLDQMQDYTSLTHNEIVDDILSALECQQIDRMNSKKTIGNVFKKTIDRFQAANIIVLFS